MGSLFTACGMIRNLMEVKARGGRIIALVYDGDQRISAMGMDAQTAARQSSAANDMFWMPPTHEYVAPITGSIPVQLFAYHVAELGGEEIDQPHNLAKTFTV